MGENKKILLLALLTLLIWSPSEAIVVSQFSGPPGGSIACDDGNASTWDYIGFNSTATNWGGCSYLNSAVSFPDAATHNPGSVTIHEGDTFNLDYGSVASGASIFIDFQLTSGTSYPASWDGFSADAAVSAPGSIEESWSNLAAYGITGVGSYTAYMMVADTSQSFDPADVESFALNVIAAIPVPAAAWLFGSALGLVGFLRRRAA